MAALKDTVVSGSLRATDTLYSTTAQFQILKAPTVSSGSTYGAGSNGQILRTNGTSTYWGDLNDVAPAINGVYYGTCATAAATQAKEVTLVNGTNFTLAAGTMIVVKFTYASAASTMTLNVAGTGAKTIYMYGTTLASSGTTTTGWAAGAIVMFIYDGTSWFRQYWYNTTYDLSQVLSGSATAEYNIDLETSANGGLGQHRYVLMMMTTNQKWSAISAVSGSTTADQGTAVAKVASTANFLIDSPIMYTNSNSYIAPGGSGPFNGYTAIAHNFRYSIGTTAANVSLSYQKPIYLVGIPNNDGATFKLDSTQWWTQTLPTTNDGKIYIYLGLAYTASNIYLNAYHPIFCHNGTNVVPYISGGVMGGNLTVSRVSGNSGVNVTQATVPGQIITLAFNTSGSQGIWSTGYGASGTSTTSGKWLVSRNSSGQVILNGVIAFDSTATCSSANNGGTTVSHNVAYVGDSGDNCIARIRQNAYTNGNTSLALQSRNYNTSSSSWGDYLGIIIQTPKDNTVNYIISQPKNFLTALGVIYSNTTPTTTTHPDLTEGYIWLKPI